MMNKYVYIYITFLLLDGLRVAVEPNHSFPVNGSRIQIVCRVDGSDEQKMPNVQFIDANNKAYTNGSSPSIISVKNTGSYYLFFISYI